MTADDIRMSDKQIRKMVDESYEDPSERCCPIYDGVIDSAEYMIAPYKILWILKEPWDDFDGEGNPQGGGWSFQELFEPEDLYDKVKQNRTLKNVVYITYAILNRMKCFDDMDFIEDCPSMVNCLRSVAYINVKKLPGKKQSDNRTIQEYYELGKAVIKQQIDAYKPDLIIGCRPHMVPIMLDHGVQQSDIEHQHSVRFNRSGIQKFIEAYHPSQRQLKREAYVDGVVRLANTLLKDKN